MGNAGRLIAVTGSRGGAGTSCLAAAIALALSRRVNCVLVDLVTGGGGLDVLLGIETAPGARWPDLAAARGEIDGTDVKNALPGWSGVPVLSASRLDPTPVPDEVVLDVCAGLLRNGAVVVLDLPILGSWMPAIRALLHDADQILVVTPDSTQGLAGAAAVATGLAALGIKGVADQATWAGARLVGAKVSPALILRSRTASRVSEVDVAKLVGLPVAARFNDDRNLATALDLGAGPSGANAKRLVKAGQAIATELMRMR